MTSFFFCETRRCIIAAFCVALAAKASTVSCFNESFAIVFFDPYIELNNF